MYLTYPFNRLQGSQGPSKAKSLIDNGTSTNFDTQLLTHEREVNPEVRGQYAGRLIWDDMSRPRFHAMRQSLSPIGIIGGTDERSWTEYDL